MDFAVAYTPLQQQFREEVRAFFEANIPPILQMVVARRIGIGRTAREEAGRLE